MICRKCGAELPNETKECEFCGYVMQSDNAINEDEEKRQRQIEKLSEEKQQQLSEIQKRRDSKKAREKRTKIFLVLLIVAIVAAGVTAGTYYYKELRESGEALPTPIVQETKAPATASPEPTQSPAPSATPEATIKPEGESWTATQNQATSKPATASNTNKANTTTKTPSKTANTVATNTTSATFSGISTKAINSQMAVGGEVVNDNGNSYMTFVSGNIKYYANVNKGATTDQVKNKFYTLTATPTSVTYKGNTVYEITNMIKYEGKDYILPDSSSKLLTAEDINGLSKVDLGLARNEIYARHGRKFKLSQYQKYFESKPWYKVSANYNYADDNKNLTELEIKNVRFIIDAENR